MYLRRKVDSFLIDWKNNPDRKPLIVKGARQIGKTRSIEVFAENNYQNVVSINFALEPKYKAILSDGYDVDSVIKNISLIDPSKHFSEGITLILFDEIQDCPDIATTLKSFCLDKRFDVICSGSMLGINYKKIHSNSVGYKTDYEMYSLDFEEYLWAKGYNNAPDEILSHMVNFKPFSDTELNVYRSLFLEYVVLGGMPAVVSSFIEKNTYEGSLEAQRQIVLDYEEDIRKYVDGLEQTRILNVYRSIPAQLAKENKKFMFSSVSPKARSREYSGCIDWLSDSGIVNICYCMGFPELPIKGNVDFSKFKLYCSDTGLLISQLDEEAQIDVRANKNLGTYKGALYENFVAEAFVKQNLPIVYYKRENSTLEEDFFVRNTDELLPVEVKANGNSSKSLRTLIESDHYPDIRRGIKLSDSNIGNTGNIITFPYFCAFQIKRFLVALK